MNEQQYSSGKRCNMVRSLHRLIRMPSSSGIELSHHPNDDETLLMLQARDRVSNLSRYE